MSWDDLQGEIAGLFAGAQQDIELITEEWIATRREWSNDRKRWLSEPRAAAALRSTQERAKRRPPRRYSMRTFRAALVALGHAEAKGPPPYVGPRQPRGVAVSTAWRERDPRRHREWKLRNRMGNTT